MAKPKPAPDTELATLIRQSGVSQKDIAAALGQSASHVSRLCAGEYVLDIRDVEPLAKILNTTVLAVVKAGVASAPPRSRSANP